MFTTNKSQIPLWNFSYKLQTCAKIFTSRELCEGRICKYSLHHCLAYTRNNRSFSAVFWRSKASLKFKNIFINLYSFSSIMITKYGTSLHTSSIFSTTQSGHHHLSSIRAPNIGLPVLTLPRTIQSPCQSCLTLCDPMVSGLPGSSVHGILQARILEWAATASSRVSSRHRDWTQAPCVSCITGRFFYQWDTWEDPIPVRATFFDPDKNF